MKQDVNYFLGNNIRKYREERKLSQEKFAHLCHISRAYYGRIERGEYRVTVDMCKRIADALGIPIFMLFVDLPE